MASSTNRTGRTSSTPRTRRSGTSPTQMTPFRDYRHRVDIVVEDQVFNWPILLSDIEKQSRSQEIKAAVASRGVDGKGARAGGELRGVVPRADGPDPL